MYWQDWSHELRDVLGLAGSPVAITYANEPVDGAAPGKRWACRAFREARDGAVITITAETSGCPGGTTFLGLREIPREHQAAIADFLVNGEKLMASHDVFFRARAHGVPAPLGLGLAVVFAPLERAELAPQLVMFLCNPMQASRLVLLANFETGTPIDVRVTGSTCAAAVAAPLYTGQIGLSLIDTTSRHMCRYDANEMIVTIPVHLMHGVMRSLDRCSAGRAPIEWPDAMKAIMREG
jgi:uncharacterized protein (DUF169 family)